MDVDCGYYKYFPNNDEKQPLFCYHLKKCAPRVIKRSECPLERNNYIDHFLFMGKHDSALKSNLKKVQYGGKRTDLPQML